VLIFYELCIKHYELYIVTASVRVQSRDETERVFAVKAFLVLFSPKKNREKMFFEEPTILIVIKAKKYLR